MQIRCFLLIAALASLPVQAKLKVVATLPDFGAIAEQVGGDLIQVTTICRGSEDPHFVDARPSFIRVLNQADVLIEGGADLEIGWLPPLVNGARNQKILGDAPGHVVLSKHLRLLDIPAGAVDRSMGDVHPLGNPHFWLDPGNGKTIAGVLAEAFGRVDAANAQSYRSNADQFSRRLDDKIKEWTQLLTPYRGRKVVTYHKSFDYLLDRFGLVLAGTLEPKPGIEPSPGYVNSLVPRLKDEGVKVIIIEPFRPRKTASYVAQSIGGKLVVLPEKVGGNEKARDYLSLFDYDLTQMAEALKETK